ncbi:CoF synthetase [Ascidiimonas sp. W6]|uniref:CoF synthetase n=1 Tax=Ascidiimonas meishanensis TaxID=3128903 RepID=UPI0030EC3BB4
MRLTQKLRKTAYWSLDFLKGAPVRKHYRQVSKALQYPTNNNTIVQQNQTIKQLLQYTSNNIPYYQKLVHSTKLEDFPVVDKNDIRKQQELFLSPLYKKDQLHKLTTSGSTGTPFTIYQDANKKNRNAADVFFFAEQAGFEIGNTLYYMRHWTFNVAKNKFLAFLQNVVPIETSYLKDKAIEDLLTQLKKDTSTKGFIGYASYYNTLVNYMQRAKKSPTNYNIKSIIAISESLPKETKELMEYFFNCSVVSRYSNMENGIIAQQLPNKGDDFYINTASYIVEVLDFTTNLPVKDGKPGKIVVTDLFNYAMPMIRYDTGDVGVLDKDRTVGNIKLTRVDGRKMDVIMNTKGEILSSFVSMHVIKYPGILQTQMIQEGKKEYKFKLCITKDFNSEEAIKKEYLDTLGKDASITFEYVDEIPLLHSGKRKMMVNNYLTNLDPSNKK